MKGCARTHEQLRRHYEVEKELADKLKNATRAERTELFKTIYDELFERVPDHPRHSRKGNPSLIDRYNVLQFKLVKDYVNSEAVFVEFAPGDCSFAWFIAPYVRHVYGIDISDQEQHTSGRPDNFSLIVYNGYELEWEGQKADIVYSNQMIEHLHPDDVRAHFLLVRSLLSKDGVYIFCMPHRLSGPHDISKYFSDTAEGFHLKEWTYAEIDAVLRNTGFSGKKCYWFAKGILVRLPYLYFTAIEYVLERLPYRWRKGLARYAIPKITIVAHACGFSAASKICTD